jgi:hypothetical protein
LVITKKYYLINSILLDNYSIIYLINNISLLDSSKIIYSNNNNIIEYSILSLPIIGYNICIIKNILISINRSNIEDLVLTNIVFISGFYINIVSEAQLEKVKLWFYRLDYILRYSIFKKSIIITLFIRKFNLVFLQFKKVVFSYPSILNNIPISNTIIIYLAIYYKINKPFR